MGLLETKKEMDGEELLKTLEQCKIGLEELLLRSKSPLQVDTNSTGLPSPPGTESPPLSPGVPAVYNDERLPIEIMLRVLWYASLPTIVAFKSTCRYWNSVALDLPPTTARLLRCWEFHSYLVRHGWRGSSPGVHGVWELDLVPLQRWIIRFDKAIENADVAARLPATFLRFMNELPNPNPTSQPTFEYLAMKRPSLPPSPPRCGIPFLNDFPLQIDLMYLLNHPSWYTEDMYVRFSLTPTRYTDLKRPWFSKRDRKTFDRKYHRIRDTPKPPPPNPARRLFSSRRVSPTPSRGYLSDTSSDDGTPEWEKATPEGPHAYGPNLIHFIQHTLPFPEKEEEWPPAHILCVQIALLQATRHTQRRASQPAFLLDIEVECMKSDDMAFLEWCIPDDGIEYHLVMAVEGEMQGYIFVEAERQLLTLVGLDWGDVYERWLTRCAGYMSRNDDIYRRLWHLSPNPHAPGKFYGNILGAHIVTGCKQLVTPDIIEGRGKRQADDMAPDTGLQSFVGAPASMGLHTIPSSPRTFRDAALEDEFIDPDAKLILSDFTQITEYFPMDLYRSLFFINTLDHDYNQVLDAFDQLARKLFDTSLSDNEVSKIKLEMSRNLNLMMANRNETLAEATRLYETADQSFNTLDNSISVAEENLQNPPSESYFLATPPPEAEEDEDLSDLGSSDEDMDIDEAEGNDEDDSGVSVKTVDLKPSHLTELELKALRRRMKKSFTWIPKQACIKKELQTYGRWPLPASSAPDKAARRKLRLAKIKRKRQRQLRVIQRERVAAARKAAAQARAQAEKLKSEQLKKKPEVQYSMPVAANEPTYCYCGDVSYGEMIACENEKCPREWFHLECAGLTTAPKGKWYCRDCKPEGHVRRKR